jgi:hypothetical protein
MSHAQRRGHGLRHQPPTVHSLFSFPSRRASSRPRLLLTFSAASLGYPANTLAVQPPLPSAVLPPLPSAVLLPLSSAVLLAPGLPLPLTMLPAARLGSSSRRPCCLRVERHREGTVVFVHCQTVMMPRGEELEETLGCRFDSGHRLCFLPVMSSYMLAIRKDGFG